MTPIRPHLASHHLQLLPARVDLLQAAGVLHGQVDIGDGELVCEVIDHLHPILHGGELLLEELQYHIQGERARGRGGRRTVSSQMWLLCSKLGSAGCCPPLLQTAAGSSSEPRVPWSTGCALVRSQ